MDDIRETVEQILEELALNQVLEEFRNGNIEECIDLLSETGFEGDQIDDLNGLLAELL